MKPTLGQTQEGASGQRDALAESQSHTDRRLDALMDIVREGRDGKSDAGS